MNANTKYNIVQAKIKPCMYMHVSCIFAVCCLYLSEPYDQHY